MANTNIGKWSATATLDARGFTTGANQIVSQTQRVGKAFTTLGTGLASVGIGVGVGALAAAINRMTGDVESLSFLNDELGTTVEWLSRVQTLASEAGLSQEQFGTAMQRFNQTLGRASLGSDEAAQSFMHLGLSIQTLQGMSFEQRFHAVANALGGIEDRAVRARIATELFGRGGGGNILRIVSGLDEGLANVQPLTAEAAERINRIDASMDHLTTTWRNTWREFLSETAPQLITTFQMLSLIVQGIGHGLNFVVGTAPINPSATGAPQTGLMRPGSAAAATAAFIAAGGGLNNAVPNFPGSTSSASGMFGLPQNWFNGLTAGLRSAVEGLRTFRDNIERGARITADTQTPLQQFQGRMRELSELRRPGVGGIRALSDEAFARATADAFRQLRSSITDAPGLGSLEAGSAEVAAIIAHANDPIMDVQQALLAAQQEDGRTLREAKDILREILTTAAQQPALVPLN